MTIDIDKIKSHVHMHVQTAARDLPPDGDIEPCILLYVPGRPLPILFGVNLGEDGPEKQIASLFLSAVAIELKAEALALMSTAWFSAMAGGRPSQNPERRECVWASIERLDASGGMILFNIERHPDASPTFAPVPWADTSGPDHGVSGTFNGILQRDPADIPEEIRAMAKEMTDRVRAQIAAQTVH